MEIPEVSTIRGVKPQDFLTTELELTICIPEGENDTVAVEERKNTKDGGAFKQYAVFGRDNEGNDRKVSFLFAADIQDLRQHFGAESLGWVGRKIAVTGKKDGKYYRTVIRAVEIEVTA